MRLVALDLELRVLMEARAVAQRSVDVRLHYDLQRTLQRDKNDSLCSAAGRAGDTYSAWCDHCDHNVQCIEYSFNRSQVGGRQLLTASGTHASERWSARLFTSSITNAETSC